MCFLEDLAFSRGTRPGHLTIEFSLRASNQFAVCYEADLHFASRIEPRGVAEYVFEQSKRPEN